MFNNVAAFRFEGKKYSQIGNLSRNRLIASHLIGALKPKSLSLIKKNIFIVKTGITGYLTRFQKYISMKNRVEYFHDNRDELLSDRYCYLKCYHI